MRRKYAVLYTAKAQGFLSDNEGSIIFQDDGDPKWYMYLADAGDKAEELVEALNVLQDSQQFELEKK